MPTRVSWPAGWPRPWPTKTASPPPTSRAPASSTCASRPRAQGVIVDNVLAAGPNYGDSEALEGQNINLEFVSANPTGPIHIGGTRWAAVGDALGRLLSTQGADVVREYYFNDHGAQIDRFTNSLIAAAKGEPAPEDGYAGDYIDEIAAQVLAKEPDALSLPDDEMRETFRAIGVDLMFTHIKQSLHDFGTDFDVYTHEDSMHSSGRVEQAIAKLREAGSIYEKDGAVWLRTTDFGDDKDRVVIKSDGQPAYIAGDIAYYPGQAPARLRPVHLHARCRPPRLHRPAQGRRRGPR